MNVSLLEFINYVYIYIYSAKYIFCLKIKKLKLELINSRITRQLFFYIFVLL